MTLKSKDIMVGDVIKVEANTTVRKAARELGITLFSSLSPFPD